MKKFIAVTLAFTMLIFCSVSNDFCIKADAATQYTFLFPVKNGSVYCVYGISDKYGSEFHSGIDIHTSKNSNAENDNTVYAACGGYVVATANSCTHINSYPTKCVHYNDYGNKVVIEHADGTRAYYGHLEKDSILVEKGDYVEMGQPIAKVGSSGYSSGPHLHFEVRKSSSTINVNKDGGVVTYIFSGYKSSSPVYPILPEGDYFIESKSGGFLTTAEEKTDSKTDVVVGSFANTSAFKAHIFSAFTGNKIRLCHCNSSSLLVNQFSATPKNGTNVNIYDDDGTTTLCWYFDPINDEYSIIRSAANPSLCMTVSNGSVVLNLYHGADTQIWKITKANEAQSYKYLFPIKDGKIAYLYGYTDDYFNGTVFHYGIDIHAKTDDTIYAAYSGTVVDVYNNCSHVSYGANCGDYYGFGNLVKILQDDGTTAYYAHLKQNSILVSKGQKVHQGQAIATMGSSGYSTGKHLHFQVCSNDNGHINQNTINLNATNGNVSYIYDGYDGYTPITYDNISTSSKYYLKNNSTGTYFTVDDSVKDKNNFGVVTLSALASSDTQKLNLSIVSNAGNYFYKLRPECCSSRIINVYGSKPTSGNAVNIYDDVSDNTQWFGFEKVDGGYVIRMKYASSLVLTANGTNVIVSSYTGAKNQIWSLIDVAPATYTMSYNPNGGTLSSSGTFTVEYGEVFTVENNSCKRTGYTLSGWNAKRNNDSTWYVSGKGWLTESEISSNGYTKSLYLNGGGKKLDDSWIKGISGSATYTFYAVWKANTYTITYDANGGTGAPASQTKTYGVDITLASVKPTRSGYTFVGWATSSTATAAA